MCLAGGSVRTHFWDRASYRSQRAVLAKARTNVNWVTSCVRVSPVPGSVVTVTIRPPR